jgi:hypothetical protein
MAATCEKLLALAADVDCALVAAWDVRDLGGLRPQGWAKASTHRVRLSAQRDPSAHVPSPGTATVEVVERGKTTPGAWQWRVDGTGVHPQVAGSTA